LSRIVSQVYTGPHASLFQVFDILLSRAHLQQNQAGVFPQGKGEAPGGCTVGGEAHAIAWGFRVIKLAFSGKEYREIIVVCQL